MELITTIISILSSIAVLVSLIIAYRALIEVRKQRETIYLPDLITKGYEFSCYAEKADSYIKVRYCYLFDTNFLPIDDAPHKNPFYIDLYNIGLGTAKNITIRFDINISEVIKEIERIANDNHKSKIVKFELGENWLNYDAESYTGGGITIADYMLRKEIGFLLPTSANNGFIKVEFPYVITILINVFNYVLYRCYESFGGIYYNNDKRVKIPLFPTFHFYLEYQDINNKIHNKTYSINVNNEMEGYAQGFLTLKEKNED